LNERCDDGNAKDGDGCSSICMWEKGWACTGNPGAYSCHATTCGDGKTEGTEGCDDTNHDLGDGCTPLCSIEPDCKSGACQSKCGDGLLLTSVGEVCDDGNTVSGDGCSSECKVEEGYQCKQPPLGESMVVPIVYRDFKAGGDFEPAGATGRNLALTGMVQATLNAQGKPVLSNAIADSFVTSAASFSQWYKDTAGVNTTLTGELKLWKRADGSYVNRWGPNGEPWRITTQVYCGDVGHEINGVPCTFEYQDTDCQTFASSIVDCVKNAAGTQWMGVMVQRAYDGTPVFFPLDGATGMITPAAELTTALIPTAYGGNWSAEPGAKKHNFGFTSEARYWFKFATGQTYKLDFTGDDDVWVFINKKLAVDLGGIHTPVSGSITLNANGNGTVTITQSEPNPPPAPTTTPVSLGLQNGQVYEIVVFQAERKTQASSYMLTLSGFNASASVCGPICGDGILAPGEQCDDGTNAGGYGKCQPDCVRGPYCGDGVVNGPEACDNGANVSAYGSDGCAPGCTAPARCGDGVVQPEFNETCDDGKNDGTYGGCSATCGFAPRCGDGTVNGPDEQCDDGANDGSYDNCAPGCKLGPRCGDGELAEAFGEQCDDGNRDNGDNCSANCRLEGVCGDTIVDTAKGEECDDGVNDGGYGECAPECKLGPRCGDGVTQAQEACDGGENPTGAYGECAKGCVLGPHCGDGRVQPAYEECDDGNKTDRDGCSPACKTEVIQF
jgi:fibro-slime domain-containing protein